MTAQEWSILLRQYGQSVTLHQETGTILTKAFLQPLRETRSEQQIPSPLGLRREDRFLYLGSPEYVLSPKDWIEWNDRAYDVWSTHPIYMEQGALYIWAVLIPRDREPEVTP